jgi:predicted permease
MAVVPTSDVRFLVPQAGAPMTVGSAGVMAVVGLVLLIACANVAGLLIARTTARRREVSVRLAIGATRRRLIQQWLAEGLVLGALGSIAAAGSAWMLVRALAAVRLPLPADLSLDLTVDARVLTFAVMVALTAGLAASLVPALKASSWNLAGDLRGDRPVARVAGRRVALADALVIAQVALTSVLLVTAGLLLRSLGESERADVGFRTNDLAVVSFETDMVRYSSEKGEQFWRDAVARVRALPGVLSVATASSIPFELNFSWTDMRMDNRAYADGTTGDVIEYRYVSPGYLETIGVRLVEGRDVTEADRRGGPLVALVNQTMARTYWPGESALGHSFRVAATNDQYVIVGVFADHKRHNVLEAPAPLVHFASAQRPSTYSHLIVRATGSPDMTLAAVRRELLGMEPNLVFVNNQTLERTIGTSLLPARVGAMLAAGFGGLGTLLAAIGLYGVVAFSVARRTREIGVRVALGAGPSEVLAMVLRQGFALVAVGLGIGALLASAAAQGLSGLLFGVAPLDPSAWALAAATMIVAAALATLVPARRAMRVDPVTALRAE